MKTKLETYFQSKAVLIAGAFILFSSSFLNAWEIKVLNPQSPLGGGYLPDAETYSSFMSYLDVPGTTISTGSLSTYNVVTDTADTLILNLSIIGDSYTKAEINALTSILNSGIRILVFGEHNSWEKTNEQLATILKGNYGGSSPNNIQTTISGAFPEITDGVTTIRFDGPGKISPVNGNGISLVSDDAMTLWGQYNSFLLMMDINALQNEHINQADNLRLTMNIAHFLGEPVIPEPSTYGTFLGLALIGYAISRRKR